MVRQPKDLAEAKEIIREEKAKLTSAISTVAGSRWLLAILATFTLGFGTHLLYAPSRLPAIDGLSIAHFGIPTDLDFGFAGEQIGEAARAASDYDVLAMLSQALASNPQLTNQVGFALALALLLANITIMTLRRRTTRG